MTTLSFVIFSISVIVLKVAPPGAETTMTTLAFVIFDGLGCSIGGSVSGILYKTSNSQTLVRSMFGLTLLFVEQNLLVQVSVLPSRNGKPYHGKQLIEI